ncbi:RagB/SusD family nutrient uptake outer membrane protein [Bacteroides stercoris]|uniref:RagB/SusD family nutrient uptake outer membrane protein n=1 Tax=Bacteroides stercoris TaxID=46506 RepID=A0A414KZ45_BACSE|nr:RagB/SusD family nutrient uptake outer membrane protein [Bacteroides stercoris]KAB5265691.1 RagB/SusD family nutrient uptake outer membrane protein [Bacteroides stercoris]KAB5284147.1 RagB/SusD family nutrient uptake outer membrane protein [Bacteroides stercoris]KAB5286929.1 RagB/SusD family nutrient uptake outer membrane protein [Bacteroides stercoris]KAB5287522.1 RagB/SusD family nutrient uptake outer membrane protein [Bacteroides stercoris]
MFAGCSDFLDMNPNGILDEESVSGVEQLDKLVISAYSMLGNDHYDIPFNLWPYGNVRSDDAYKGGRDESDIQDFHFYETSSNITANFGEPDGLWYNCYIAISRANNALRSLNNVSEQDFPNKKIRIGECRFIRGHFYFLLKVLFKSIPYIDETVAIEDYGTISNIALSNDELWQKIADDFKAAYDNLPESQGTDVGRANKYSAAAYLAKTYLYKAYRQDEKHNVTEINAEDLKQVLTFSNEVMSSDYGLEDDFAYNFLPGSYENGKESLFAIQHSTDDGTLYGRLNFSDALNVPMKFSGSCDFQKPSQNLVNAYKTVNGLPEFSDYNKADYNANTDKVDPRLYHTVALPGVPYKYDKKNIFDESWTRNKAVYGLYSSLKENVALNDPSSVLIDPFRANTKNKIVIRYADVVLMRAEALIELDREKEALPLINEIRERAKKSTGLIDYAENMDIALYVDNVNCNWTKPYAREALRWERRLELAMESQRFFDLVRWGIADSVINTFYKEEAPKRTYYEDAHFEKNRAEYVPIPQQQINFSKQVYKQNYGY